VGSHSKHKDGQYHFEIENGKVRWFHRNENHDTIFSLLTRPTIREGVWTQITATYSASKQRARVFVNGDMREEVKGQGLLSLDWGGKAGIGRHKHPFGNRLLRGMIDEFYIFPCELPRLEILVLMRHCRVYFTNKPKKLTEESSTTRGSATIMTPPANGQRYNGPIALQQAHPAVPQGITSLGPAYQRKPAPTDYVAGNLQQILASLNAEEPNRSGLHPSSLYRPPQGYSAPLSQNKQQTLYRPAAPYTKDKPLSGASQLNPQLWSANFWANHPPRLAAPFATQASIKYNTRGGMQKVASIRHGVPPTMQPLNAYHLPGTVPSFLAQASFRHENPVAMQKVNANRLPDVLNQLNTVGAQRVPLRQNNNGQLQRFSAQKGPERQYQSQGTKIIQPKVSWGNINSAEQFHTPIIWHMPLENARTGPPLRLQRPYYPASPVDSTGQRTLERMKPLNVFNGAYERNRTAGIIQNAYVAPSEQLPLIQKPLVQKQRVNFMQPLRRPSNVNPLFRRPKPQVPISFQRQQQQQKSLADKMPLLEQPKHVSQSDVPASSPWQKEMPSTQMATSTKDQSPGRPYYSSNMPRPPYLPNVQHRLLTIPARTQIPSKGPLAPTTWKIPQGIPPRQIAPFSPHFISGKNSWPWGPWRNQASPVAQASSRSTGVSRLQAYGNPLASYHPGAGLVSNLPASPYTMSPKVLLYYYFYPKTINRPLMKMTSLKGEKLDGNYLQKLTQQISSAALNNMPGVVMTTGNPTVTGQTKGKSTVTKFNKVPNGNSKQLTQIPYVPHYNLETGSANFPLSRGMSTGPLAKRFRGKTQAQTHLLLPQLRKGAAQLTSLPLIPYQTAWTSPHVTYPHSKLITQPQRVAYPQRLAVADRESQLTNGLLNRPIYIETVPYQLYYQLQKMPSFNTQSSTQQYLARVLNDILRLRYGKLKHKKRKRGVKEKSRKDKDSRKGMGRR